MKMDMVTRGLRNEIFGVLVSFCTGLIMGIIASQVYDPDFRSHEMISRGTSNRFITLYVYLLH